MKGFAVAKSTAKPKRRDRQIARLAELFKVLAEPNRLRIIALLLEYEELTVSELCEEVKQSQPAVSHHLTALRDVGLVDYRQEGRFNFYAINPTGLHPLFELFFPNKAKAKVDIAGIEATLKKS